MKIKKIISKIVGALPWDEVTSTERNQVVFEKLNKQYGAYEIRTNYDRTLVFVLKSVSATVALLISIYIFTPSNSKIKIEIPFIPMERIQAPIFEMPKEIPKEKPLVPEGRKPDTKENLIPLVTTDSIIERDTATFVVITNTSTTSIGKDSTDFLASTLLGTASKGRGTDLPVDSTFDGVFIQEPPQFPGGTKAMFEFLRNKIIYPYAVKEVNGSGVAGVSFIIDQQGNVTQVGLAKETKYYALDQEAMRVVKLKPQWIPGRQQGQPVKVRMILPIRFELKR